MGTIFSPSKSAKAWVAFAVTFLTPIAALLASQQTVITWRTFAAALVGAAVSALGVFVTTNAQADAHAATDTTEGLA